MYQLPNYLVAGTFFCLVFFTNLMKPKIILVITNKETNAQIKRFGVDMLELRADLLPKISPDILVKEIKNRRALRIPILLTVRNQKEEGGLKVFSDQNKWALLEAGLPLVDMVDIELSSPLLKTTVALAHRLKKKVIVSSHDFKVMPTMDALENTLRKSKAAGGDFIKIAATASTETDTWRMIDFTRKHHDQSLITIAMGATGKVSRLLLPLAGSQFTYTFIGAPKAPGQIDIKTLLEHIKFYYT